MTLVPVLSFSMFWGNSPSDLSKCFQCKETIYGTMFYPVVEVEENNKIESTTFHEIPEPKYCNSCYKALGGE